jgi:starch synthase
MKKANVLFVSQEIMPFVEETPIGRVARNLPQLTQEMGREIRTFMPRYGNINERRNNLHEVIRLSGMNIVINDTDNPLIIKVASIPKARMQVYFIDNEDFFKRKFKVKDAKGKLFEDNDDRIIFYSRGVMETIKQLKWSPDVISIHGWMATMVPLYLKSMYQDNTLFSFAKIITTLYDDDFEGKFRKEWITKLKYDGIKDEQLNHLVDLDYLALMKTAIDNSDAMVMGSPSINKELESYAIETGKPILEYNNDEEYIQAYNDFFDEILGDDFEA